MLIDLIDDDDDDDDDKHSIEDKLSQLKQLLNE